MSKVLSVCTALNCTRRREIAKPFCLSHECLEVGCEKQRERDIFCLRHYEEYWAARKIDGEKAAVRARDRAEREMEDVKDKLDRLLDRIDHLHTRVLALERREQNS